MAPITRASVQAIPLSYASCSIGCGSSDTLPRKLEAISKAGFTAIELSFPDILEYAALLQGHPISSDNFSELVIVADGIRKLCDANSLAVMMLQPFANFEGWPKGSTEREDAFTRARGWIEIMKVLGTDLMQVWIDLYRDVNSRVNQFGSSELRIHRQTR
jgi:sugar phosphate isomerase/epimerase